MMREYSDVTHPDVTHCHPPTLMIVLVSRVDPAINHFLELIPFLAGGENVCFMWNSFSPPPSPKTRLTTILETKQKRPRARHSLFPLIASVFRQFKPVVTRGKEVKIHKTRYLPPSPLKKRRCLEKY